MDDVKGEEVVYRNFPGAHEGQEEVDAEKHDRKITLLLPVEKIGGLHTAVVHIRFLLEKKM